MEQKISIVQLNICGAAGRSHACTDNYINQKLADLVFLSETKTEQEIMFTNYETITKTNQTSPRLRGGVSLSVRSSYELERITSLEADNVDAIFAIVTLGSTRIMVSSVYIPPNSPSTLCNYLSLISNAMSQLDKLKCSAFAAFGDLNCRHCNWGDHKNNAAGIQLTSFIQNCNLQILCQFQGNSFLCADGGSRIDLGIVCSKFYGMVDQQSTDDSIELFTGAPIRGHLPIWTTINQTKHKHKQVIIDNWSATSWCQYQATLEKLSVNVIPRAQSLQDPSELWILIRDILLQTKQQIVPQKKITGHSKPYWNPQLTTLSNEVRKARKKFKARSTMENLERLNACKALFNEALALAKTQYLEMQAKKLNQKNSSDFWCQFKRTFYNKTGNRSIPALTNSNGITITNDITKAQLFYDEIFRGKHLDSTKFDHTWYTRVLNNVAVLDQNCNTDSLLNHSVTIEEITTALQKTKHAGKSKDFDGIHPKMLINAGPQFHCLLFLLFNLVLETQKWPWQKSKVIFLKKPGKKDYSNCASYRPISITSYVGKLCERILESRIRMFAENNKLIPETQHGFRANRSTGTCISNLFRAVQDGNKRKMKTAGLFIDLQKAFDSVWVEGLLYKLHEIGIRGRLLSTLKSYLLNRKLEVNVNNYTTAELPCSIGVPQGSVLSPLLFTLYVSDMLNNVPGLGLQFADDTSVVISANTDINLQTACQTACISIQNWLYKWRMQANADKSALLLFKGEISPPLLNNSHISKVQQTKVLGVWVDDNLKCSYQLQLARKTLNDKWNMLKPFLANKLKASVAKKYYRR